MSAIPDDVMREAKRIDSSLEYFIEDDEWHQNIIEGIARAILAERQRCAAIALCVFDDDDVWSDSHRTAGGIIAEAILAGDSA